ncbi:MAG: glycosyltransferase [Lachnospiraceae bacterium]|nr:glycosyltransferase [Lachnospiraceae bacterium]
MKILVIGSIDNNPYNGVPRAVPGMVNALKEVMTKDSGDKTLEDTMLDDKAYQGINLRVTDQIGFLNTRSISINGIDCQLMPTKNSLKELPYPFNKPDLVVFHEVYYPAFVGLGKECKKNHIPYIIIPHGCLTKEALEIKKWKKRIGNELLFKDFVMGAETLQFLSPSEKRRTIFKKDGFIGLNGVTLKSDRHHKKNINFADTKHINSNDADMDQCDISEETDNTSGDKKSDNIRPYTMFTYIGRIDMHIKGLDLLVKAVAQNQDLLREKLCCIKLYGPDCNDSKSKLTILANDLGVSDLIEINGPVEEEKKEEILLNSDIFIQTSRSEALPMGLLEALSYGLPCIVSRGTGFAGLINRYKAGWGEIRNIAELINKAVSEKTTYPQKSANACRLIQEHFEIKKCAENVLKCYRHYAHT